MSAVSEKLNVLMVLSAPHFPDWYPSVMLYPTPSLSTWEFLVQVTCGLGLADLVVQRRSMMLPGPFTSVVMRTLLAGTTKYNNDVLLPLIFVA